VAQEPESDSDTPKAPDVPAVSRAGFPAAAARTLAGNFRRYDMRGPALDNALAAADLGRWAADQYLSNDPKSFRPLPPKGFITTIEAAHDLVVAFLAWAEDEAAKLDPVLIVRLIKVAAWIPTQLVS
jgi:hypothetical protein